MTSSENKRRADLKVVIMGTMDVGKTALIHRYLEGKFISPENTIGASFSLKKWGPYNVAIWDTAGQERFRGLSSFYCRSAGAAILAFDLTNERTLTELNTTFLPLLQAAEPDCLCVVVGTKADLVVAPTSKRVSMEKGYHFTKSLNPQRNLERIPYFETSSLTGQNVESVFDYIFSCLLPLDDLENVKVKKNPGVVDLDRSNDSTQVPVAENVSKCAC